MKTIGIIGAMEEEIQQIKSKMNVLSTKQYIDTAFYVGKMFEKNIVLVRSGIGKVNAAVCAQTLINKFDVDCCINVGVAGAIYDLLNIGDIVVSTDTVQHDFDTSSFGDKIGDIPRMKESHFQADVDLIRIAMESAKTALTENKIYAGRIASGDQFISDMSKKRWIWETFNAYCAEMEGAAIAHTCFLNNVPFVIIRSISDKADGSAETAFDKFVTLAAKNSSNIVEALINKL